MCGLDLTWQSRLSFLSFSCLPPQRGFREAKQKPACALLPRVPPQRRIATLQLSSRLLRPPRTQQGKGLLLLSYLEWVASKTARIELGTNSRRKPRLRTWHISDAHQNSGPSASTSDSVHHLVLRPCLPASRPSPRHRCLLEIQGRLCQIHAPLRAPTELLRGVMTDHSR